MCGGTYACEKHAHKRTAMCALRAWSAGDVVPVLWCCALRCTKARAVGHLPWLRMFNPPSKNAFVHGNNAPQPQPTQAHPGAARTNPRPIPITHAPGERGRSGVMRGEASGGERRRPEAKPKSKPQGNTPAFLVGGGELHLNAPPIEQSTPGFANSRVRALPCVHPRGLGSRPSSLRGLNEEFYIKKV